MSKMSVLQAAQYFGISKEAIHNRIRRGSLQSIIEGGVKYVILDENAKAPKNPQSKKNASTSENKYYELLEKQNQQLQEKITKLEDETRSLRDQKEQMLIQERKMIEQIYKEKDEQLKNILTSFQTKLMLDMPQQETEHLEVEIEESKDISQDIISLKKYCKQEGISQKKALKIKKRLKKKAKKDNRIILIGKKVYLDLDKYDYKDLLK